MHQPFVTECLKYPQDTMLTMTKPKFGLIHKKVIKM